MVVDKWVGKCVSFCRKESFSGDQGAEYESAITVAVDSAR